MRKLCAIALLVLNTPVFSQTYNTYSQGGNNNYGGAYVAPVVTKSYTFNSGSGTPTPAYNYGSGSSYSSGNSYNYSSGSSGSSGSSVLYRSNWERKYDRRQAEELAKVQAEQLAAQGWLDKAKAVQQHFADGDFIEAERVRRSISASGPSGVGDIVKYESTEALAYDPSQYMGQPFQVTYENRYHYTSMLLMAELKEYKEAEEYYRAYFTDYEYAKNDKYTYTYNHQEQTPKLVNIFKDFTYPEILQIESAYVEALEQVKGKAAAQAHWIAASNFYVPFINAKVEDAAEKSRCYNTVAMVQLQLGLGTDAVKYFKKQFKINPEDHVARFSVLQNIVAYTLGAREKDTTVIRFCLDEFTDLLSAPGIDAQPEMVYSIHYNKASLLMAAGKNEEAEQEIKLQPEVPGYNKFPHLILHANILLNLVGQPLKLNELQKRENEYPDYTPAQKHEFDSLYGSGYFNNEPNYLGIMLAKRQELSDIMSAITAMYMELSKEQLLEADILGAENDIRNYTNYDMAKMSYEIIERGADIKWPYQMRLAEISVLQENYTEAVSILTKTIAENPAEYPLYIVLADIYRNKLNKPKDAKANYKLAVAKGAVLNAETNAFITSK